MSETINIAICMGSSCFARGNNRILRVLEEAIKEHGWQDSIKLSGLLCQDCCNDGPIIKLGDQIYKGLDSGAVLDLLAKMMDVPSDAQTYFSVRKNTIRKER